MSPYNGKPRTFIIEYLGTANTLLKRLQEGISLKSYSHGDTAWHYSMQQLNLDIVNIINKYIPLTWQNRSKTQA